MSLRKGPADNEQGYILVLALVVLLMVTLFGVSSLSVSITDLQIAGNQQAIAENFSLVDRVWSQILSFDFFVLLAEVEVLEKMAC